MEDIAHRRNVNNEALAVLALGFQQLGMQDRAKAMLDRLYTHAIADAGSTHWTGVRGWDGGDIEPTALALQATLKITPNDPRAYAIVRWLMKVRHDEYWQSTRGTAMALYGMAEFLRISNELAPDYVATVLVNGKAVRGVRFVKESILEPEVELVVAVLRPGRGVVAAGLCPGRNEVRITKSGPGNLYYSTSLTQYIQRRAMPATVSGGGMSITREFFRPSASYFQSGATRDIGRSVDGCSTGQTVLVRLTVHATRPLSHILLEDNIPAGCEIIDRGDVSYDQWENWWVGQDVRDDRISFYIDELHRGKRVLEYQMRAGFAGTYSALPAQVFAMYDPTVRSTTAEQEFLIR